MNSKLIIAILVLLFPLRGMTQFLVNESDYALDSNQRFTVGLRSEAFANSTALTASTMDKAIFGGYASRDERQIMIDRASETNVEGTIFNTSIYFAHRIDTLFGKAKTNSSFYVNIADRQETNASFSKTAMQLAFFGNKQFAGKTIDLSPLNVNQYHYQQYQIGFQKTYASQQVLNVGISFLTGQTNIRTLTNKLSLTTTPKGDIMWLDAATMVQFSDTNNSNFMAYNGGGASISVSTMFPIQLLSDSNNKAEFWISASDLGMIFWNGTSSEIRIDTSYQYDGVYVQNIFDPQSEISGDNPQNILDSVATTRKVAHTTTLPFTFNFHLNQKIKNWQYTIGGMVRHKANFLPYFYGKAGYWANEKWLLSGQVNYGGYGKLGGGVELNYHYKNHNIVLGSTNVEGFIAPSQTAGQSIYVLLRYKI